MTMSKTNSEKRTVRAVLGLAAMLTTSAVSTSAQAQSSGPVPPTWTCALGYETFAGHEVSLAPGVGICGDLNYNMAPDAPVALLYSDRVRYHNPFYAGVGVGVSLMDEVTLILE